MIKHNIILFKRIMINYSLKDIIMIFIVFYFSYYVAKKLVVKIY